MIFALRLAQRGQQRGVTRCCCSFFDSLRGSPTPGSSWATVPVTSALLRGSLGRGGAAGAKQHGFGGTFLTNRFCRNLAKLAPQAKPCCCLLEQR